MDSAKASLHTIANAVEKALFPRERAEKIAATLRQWAEWIPPTLSCSTADLSLGFRFAAVAGFAAGATGPARSRAVTCAEIGNLHDVGAPYAGDWTKETATRLRRASEVWRLVASHLHSSGKSREEMDPRLLAIRDTVQREHRHLLDIVEGLEVATSSV